MISGHTTVYGAAAFAAVAVVLLVGAGPARPVQAVTYSFDGATWTATLPSPLFDTSTRWVPGDSRSAKFQVLNDTGNDGRVHIIVGGDNNEFVDALTVSINGSNPSEPCEAVKVPAGEQLLVGVTLAMNTAAGNATQNAPADIEVMVQWDDDDETMCSAASGEGTFDRQEGA